MAEGGDDMGGGAVMDRKLGEQSAEPGPWGGYHRVLQARWTPTGKHTEQQKGEEKACGKQL